MFKITKNIFVFAFSMPSLNIFYDFKYLININHLINIKFLIVDMSLLKFDYQRYLIKSLKLVLD